jgi:endo-1,4-beta-D-glucanase Y
VRFARTLAAGLILVSLAAGGHAQSGEWSLWRAYCAAFIDGQGRVIDRQGGDRTTSEGQAYAMFFAVVANDRARFEKLLTWTRDNLAQGDLTAHQPGWKWGKAPDGQWKLLDTDSAADADLWMCYALAEAGRLWQEPRYTALSKVMAARIAQEEVANLPGFGPMLMPGKNGFHPSAQIWILNPSYLPLPVLRRMAALDPGGPWASIARRVPLLLEKSSTHGFAMDWVSYSPTAGFKPQAGPTAGGAPQKQPIGSFDAIRVYLWAGMTNPGDAQNGAVLHAVDGMGAWLGDHLFPPEQVTAAGEPGRTEGPVGFSAAVIPYLSARRQKSALQKQQQRLEAQIDPGTSLYGHPPAYYDQNLAMFGEGWGTHRFGFSRGGELMVPWKK